MLNNFFFLYSRISRCGVAIATFPRKRKKLWEIILRNTRKLVHSFQLFSVRIGNNITTTKCLNFVFALSFLFFISLFSMLPQRITNTNCPFFVMPFSSYILYWLWLQFLFFIATDLYLFISVSFTFFAFWFFKALSLNKEQTKYNRHSNSQCWTIIWIWPHDDLSFKRTSMSSTRLTLLNCPDWVSMKKMRI